MLVLGLDFETTGLDKENDEITEMGGVLWDTNLNTPISFTNHLVRTKAPVPEKITQLTGINDILLDDYGVEEKEALLALLDGAESAHYIVAHNAPFDRGFLEAACAKHGLSEKVVGRKWIDTSIDVPFPESIKTRKLVHLAAEHGFVNPFAHRAVTDVLTMLQICSKYSWDDIIALSQQPTITIRALVDYNNREKASLNGYRWEGTAKVWLKNIKSGQLDKEKALAASVGFEIGEWKNG